MLNQQMQTLFDFLDQSQWLSAQEIAHKQQQHLQRVIQHAFQTVPLYQTLYADISLNDALQENVLNVPILSRELIQLTGDQFISQHVPEQHGACYPKETSGSTGKVVKFFVTDFTRLFYDALMLREHHWHQRDFTKTLMAIKWAKHGIAPAPLGHQQDTWGSPINQYHVTGRSVFINVASNTCSQIDALLLHHPQYLFSYPSQLAALAEYCITHQIQLSSLEEVRSTGESFQENYKQIIRQAWPTIKITDTYSTEEIGNIAQQCPEYGNYHVNSEHVYMEIVDENNRACDLHQPGKVLVTSLLNYATPFIRYEIGDYAEWDEACACGRGLPVIKKILGRQRNRIFLPNGESQFPYLGDREEGERIISCVRKFQFIQHTVHDIEIKLVLDAPLTLEQESQYKKLRQQQLGYPFNITLTYPDEIPLSPSGKYEEFISHVSKKRN